MLPFDCYYVHHIVVSGHIAHRVWNVHVMVLWFCYNTEVIKAGKRGDEVSVHVYSRNMDIHKCNSSSYIVGIPVVCVCVLYSQLLMLL